MINPIRLQQAREVRGCTQTALAQQVGVHQSAIVQLEVWQIQPSPEVLAAISRATDFPLAFFLSGGQLDPDDCGHGHPGGRTADASVSRTKEGIWRCIRPLRDPSTSWNGRRTYLPKPSSCSQRRCTRRSRLRLSIRY